MVHNRNTCRFCAVLFCSKSSCILDKYVKKNPSVLYGLSKFKRIHFKGYVY